MNARPRPGRLARDTAAAGGKLALFARLLTAAAAHAADCAVCAAAVRDAVPPGSAVVTDGVHLMSRDLPTLHAFAARMGLKRAWFQESGRNIRATSASHFDLITTSAFHRACANGALYVGWRAFNRGTADFPRATPRPGP